MKKISLSGIILFTLILLMCNKIQAQNHQFDSLSNELSRLASYHKTKSFDILKEMYQIAHNDSDSSLLIARCLFEESLLNFHQRILDTLLKDNINQRLDRKKIPSFEYAVLQFAKGINLVSGEKYDEAFPILLPALETFKQLKHDVFISRTISCLGAICHTINLLILAEHYLTEAMRYATPDFPGYYFMKINTFIILSYHDSEAAIDSLQGVIDFAEKEGIEELLPILYVNIGSFLLDSQPDKAFTFFNKMQNIEFDNPGMMATLYANMGTYYSIKSDYDKALHYYKKAQIIMEDNNHFQNLSILYNDISSIYEHRKEYENALFYSKKKQEAIRKLRSNVGAIETYQKYINTKIEVSKNELIIAEQTIELKNKQFIIIIIISAFTVLVILLFLFLAHQQKLRKASENRELTEKLKHEKRVQRYEKEKQKLEKEKQEERLDAKTREISSYSMLVSNKNNILKHIKDLTIQVDNDEKDAIKAVKKIDEIVQNNLDIDEEWKHFIIHFDKIHPHFFEKLKQCANLTEENLRMCAYIKMRMTTKQIAQLLNVIPRSVIINRYRLKKKFQLDDSEDLDHFIGNL